jgi:hypothetical protein
LVSKTSHHKLPKIATIEQSGKDLMSDPVLNKGKALSQRAIRERPWRRAK